MRNEFVFNKNVILHYLPIKQIITSALISGILLIGLYIVESLNPKNSIFAIVSMNNSLLEQLKLISFLSRQNEITRTTQLRSNEFLATSETSCGKIYSNETDPISITLIPFSSSGIIAVESRHKDLAFNKLRDFYDCSASLIKRDIKSYEEALLKYIDNSPNWKDKVFQEKKLTDIKENFETIEQIKLRKAFINQHLVINSEIKKRNFHFYGSIYLSIFGVMILILLLFAQRFNKLS